MQSLVQQKMFKRINQWRRSGLSKKAWCDKHEIAYATFYYWYKIYRDQVGSAPEASADKFVRLMVNDSVPGNWWCELALANGKRIVFQQPVSAEFLIMLID